MLEIAQLASGETGVFRSKRSEVASFSRWQIMGAINPNMSEGGIPSQGNTDMRQYKLSGLVEVADDYRWEHSVTLNIRLYVGKQVWEWFDVVMDQPGFTKVGPTSYGVYITFDDRPKIRQV